MINRLGGAGGETSARDLVAETVLLAGLRLGVRETLGHVWHHALPRGATPNRAQWPRVAQCLNMFPCRYETNPEGI
jgi:hypothetical protein